MSRIINETVSADGNTDATWKGLRKETPNRATVWVFGGGGNDFGSGTVTLQASPDSGTTFFDILDQTGTAITFTADGFANFELQGNSDASKVGEQVVIRLALTGSTSPTIKYIIDDVR